MTDRVFDQHPLFEDVPPDWTSQRTIRRTLSYEERAGGHLAFFYLVPQEDVDDNDPVSKALNLIIDKDSEIIIQLDANKEWRWSYRYDALTTKKDYTSLYGNLLYFDGSTFVERPGDNLNWNCSIIKFCARNNSSRHHPDKIHGFSMNIDLLQPNGKVLPITLDPDIKNPPPDPQFGDWSMPGEQFLAAA